MGKQLITQRRGRGTTTYRSPGHRFVGAAKHKSLGTTPVQGVVKDIVHCAGHSAPLMFVTYVDGEENLMIAPEGIRVNQTIEAHTVDPYLGNTICLKDMPEGTTVYNLECMPGDGGKLVRGSGTFAKIIAQQEGRTLVLLPSKQQRLFHPECRATIGIVAGGGRLEKFFAKAGKKFHKMHARNKLYPHVCGISMNAVDHPHGGSSSHSKNGPDIARRHAPPGANVGKIRPRRTGRKSR